MVRFTRQSVTKLLPSNRKSILPDNLKRYGINAGVGAGLGAGMAHMNTEDEENKGRNTLIGAGIGAGSGLAATKAAYTARMAAIPKVKGKRLLRSDDKVVILGEADNNIHVYYPKPNNKRQATRLEIENTNIAAQKGYAPKIIRETKHGFVQENAGKSLLDANLNPYQAKEVGRRIKGYERDLVNSGISHGDLHIGNIMLPNPSDIRNMQFIDWERSGSYLGTDKKTRGFKPNVLMDRLNPTMRQGILTGYNS